MSRAGPVDGSHHAPYPDVNGHEAWNLADGRAVPVDGPATQRPDVNGHDAWKWKALQR